MMKVIQADATNERGLRTVIDGKAELLTGFEFNNNSKLDRILLASFASQINREKGELSVIFPAFSPTLVLYGPPTATHFKILSAGVEVDFADGLHQGQVNTTAEFQIDLIAIPAIELVNRVRPYSKHALFLMVGIQFVQKTKGGFEFERFKRNNALAIVKVSAI